MNEGPNKFADKPRSSFAERGELTSKEKVLSRFLDTYVERQRISSTSFGQGDLASKEKILEDQNKINVAKNKMKEINKQRAQSDREHFLAAERGILSEQTMIYGMQRGQWFGNGSKVRVASEYDDIFNGVDCVVELDSTKQLALGIDTTISKGNISKKLGRMRTQILRGKLAEVRYFKNENFTGSLHNIPLTVIGVSSEANNSLADLVYATETTDQFHSEDKPDTKEKAEEQIRKHRIQFIILFEIKLQLEAFLKFAKKVGEDKLAVKLEEDLIKIKEVIASKAPKNKEEREKLVSETKNDGIFKVIKQGLELEFEEWKEPDILVAKL